MPKGDPGGRFQPGNLYGQSFIGYAVGNPEYLSSAESRVNRYWRAIEYGTDGFAGKLIGGLWTSDFSSQAQRRNLIGHGRLNTFGGTREEKFVPFYGEMRSSSDAINSALRALGYLRAHGDLNFQLYRMFRKRLESGDLNVPTIGRIKHEIPAMEAYRKGAEKFEPAQRERDAIEQVLGEMAIFTPHGTKKRVLDLRQRQPQTTTSAQFRRRTGFVSGYALSGFNQSISKVDQQLRRELAEANRLLAQGLAAEVAQVIADEHLRSEVQTKALEEATLNIENRFPH